MVYLVDRPSGHWNTRSCWRVSQVVGLELKSYSERKPFWTLKCEVQVELQMELWQRVYQAGLLRSDSRLGSLIILSDMIHTGMEVHRMDLWNDLSFSLCAALSVCHMVATSDDGKKSEMGVSADWCVAIEHWRLSSIRIIFIDYQTSKLQCNY